MRFSQVTMDETPADYGAPVYLRKSFENKLVGSDAVFVSLDAGDLPKVIHQQTFSM